MRIPRLYLPLALASGEQIQIEGDRAHYLLNVLRLAIASRLIVFNGAGGEYEAKLVAAKRGQALLEIGQWHNRDKESPLRIHLGLAIVKGERMDWAIQKATELGVHSISPLFTEYSQVRLPQEKLPSKHSHWQRVLTAACEQCGRNRLPTLFQPQAFGDWLDRQAGGVVFDPCGEKMGSLPTPEKALNLLIGPEGGLSKPELQSAIRQGFVRARLGPRILRAETAVTAAIGIVQALWGDG